MREGCRHSEGEHRDPESGHRTRILSRYQHDCAYVNHVNSLIPQAEREAYQVARAAHPGTGKIPRAAFTRAFCEVMNRLCVDHGLRSRKLLDPAFQREKDLGWAEAKRRAPKRRAPNGVTNGVSARD